MRTSLFFVFPTFGLSQIRLILSHNQINRIRHRRYGLPEHLLSNQQQLTDDDAE